MNGNGGYLIIDLKDCYASEFINDTPYPTLISDNDKLNKLWIKVGNKILKNILSGDKLVILKNFYLLDSDKLILELGYLSPIIPDIIYGSEDDMLYVNFKIFNKITGLNDIYEFEFTVIDDEVNDVVLRFAAE